MLKLQFTTVKHSLNDLAVTMPSNPFKFQISQVKNNLYRVNIYLTDGINKVGYALLKEKPPKEVSFDNKYKNQLVELTFKDIAGLTDLNMNKIDDGILYLAKINLDAIVGNHKADKIEFLKNQLAIDKDTVNHAKQNEMTTKKILNHFQATNKK